MKGPVRRPQNHSKRYTGRHKITRWHQSHTDKSGNKYATASFGVGQPPYKGTRNNGSHAEKGGGKSYSHGITAKMFYEKRERGQQGMEVYKDEKVYKTDFNK